VGDPTGSELLSLPFLWTWEAQETPGPDASGVRPVDPSPGGPVVSGVKPVEPRLPGPEVSGVNPVDPSARESKLV